MMIYILMRHCENEPIYCEWDEIQGIFLSKIEAEKARHLFIKHDEYADEYNTHIEEFEVYDSAERFAKKSWG